jgi:hypothetical protein
MANHGTNVKVPENRARYLLSAKRPRTYSKSSGFFAKQRFREQGWEWHFAACGRIAASQMTSKTPCINIH